MVWTIYKLMFRKKMKYVFFGFMDFLPTYVSKEMNYFLVLLTIQTFVLTKMDYFCFNGLFKNLCFKEDNLMYCT